MFGFGALLSTTMASVESRSRAAQVVALPSLWSLRRQRQKAAREKYCWEKASRVRGPLARPDHNGHEPGDSDQRSKCSWEARMERLFDSLAPGQASRPLQAYAAENLPAMSAPLGLHAPPAGCFDDSTSTSRDSHRPALPPGLHAASPDCRDDRQVINPGDTILQALASAGSLGSPCSSQQVRETCASTDASGVNIALLDVARKVDKVLAAVRLLVGCAVPPTSDRVPLHDAEIMTRLVALPDEMAESLRSMMLVCRPDPPTTPNSDITDKLEQLERLISRLLDAGDRSSCSPQPAGAQIPQAPLGRAPPAYAPLTPSSCYSDGTEGCDSDLFGELSDGTAALLYPELAAGGEREESSRRGPCDRSTPESQALAAEMSRLFPYLDDPNMEANMRREMAEAGAKAKAKKKPAPRPKPAQSQLRSPQPQPSDRPVRNRGRGRGRGPRASLPMH